MSAPTIDREAVTALRTRLSHTEAICGLLVNGHDSELAEAFRGVRLLIEDGIMALDAILEPRR